MKRRQTAYVILGILAIHDNQSGYEIRKTIQQTVGFFWGESFGQIYPTLKKLVADGLIAPASSDAAANGSISAPKPRRQEYSITPAGLTCLQEWLAVPYRDDPPRDEFLLKLFFGDKAAPKVSIAQIRKFQEKHRRLLDTLLEVEGLARNHSSHYPGFPFWMLTLTFGVAQLRSALEWSESALAMLSSTEAGIDPQTLSPQPPANTADKP
jgi:PadR family transcriptional regulator, regulatory protein AphA